MPVCVCSKTRISITDMSVSELLIITVGKWLVGGGGRGGHNTTQHHQLQNVHFIFNKSTKPKVGIYKHYYGLLLICPLWFHCCPDGVK